MTFICMTIKPYQCHLASLWNKYFGIAYRPFPSSKKSHFQNEAKCETFVVKMSFICIIIKNHFRINGFALSQALKVRFFGTRKWPIEMPVHLLSMYVPEKDPGTFKEKDPHTVNSSATSLRSTPYTAFSKTFETLLRSLGWSQHRNLWQRSPKES